MSIIFILRLNYHDLLTKDDKNFVYPSILYIRVFDHIIKQNRHEYLYFYEQKLYCDMFDISDNFDFKVANLLNGPF